MAPDNVYSTTPVRLKHMQQEEEEDRGAVMYSYGMDGTYVI